MKAKMFRSVEITNVPTELQEQVRQVTNTIGNACESNVTTAHVMNLDMSKVANIDCVLESIHNTRLILAEIDKELGDITNALTGFKDYVSKEAEKNQQKELLEQAMKSQQLQQAAPRPSRSFKNDPELSGPDVINEEPMTKEFIQKLAELSNVNEG